MTKTALITGAGKGFGLALARMFTSKQWNVFPVVRNKNNINELKELPNCLPIIADITRDEVHSAIRESLQESGDVDVLINNAGIPGDGAQFAETTPGQVLQLFDVHCLGALRVTQAAYPFLASESIIINVSSRFGSISKVSKGELDSATCSYSYRIAKAAQNMFTQCMCREFKDSGIRICSIHPGLLKTQLALPGADKTPEEAADKLFSMLDDFQHGTFYSLFEETIEW